MSNATRPLAVVTGASTGIGYELAKLCAENGFDLLIAADEPRIETAAGSGLEALARGWGMAPAKIRACLSNEAQHKLLSAQAQDAWETRKIPGTPAFFLNGTIVPKAASWAALKPPLDAALK